MRIANEHMRIPRKQSRSRTVAGNSLPDSPAPWLPRCPSVHPSRPLSSGGVEDIGVRGADLDDDDVVAVLQPLHRPAARSQALHVLRRALRLPQCARIVCQPFGNTWVNLFFRAAAGSMPGPPCQPGVVGTTRDPGLSTGKPGTADARYTGQSSSPCVRVVVHPWTFVSGR